MEKILEIIDNGIGWQNLIILFCLIMTTAPSIIKGFDYLIERFDINIETKGSKRRKEQASKCAVQAAAIKALEDKIAEYNSENAKHWDTSKNYQTTYSKNQQDIINQLSSITNSINSLQKKMDENELRKRIDGLRSTIISFATNLSNPQFKPSEDHYNSMFRKIEEYEKILDDNGLENGQCTISMRLIEKHYANAMERGDFLRIED